jgi:putative spermidine/putrescine transport system permease protein
MMDVGSNLGVSQPGVTGQDAVPLRVKLRRAEKRRARVSLLLILPLLVYLVLTFAIPIGIVLYESVDNPEVVGSLPRTSAAIVRWDGKDVPSEEVYAALIEDLRAIKDDQGAVGRAAKRLNYEIGGFRGLVLGVVRRIDSLDAPPYKEKLIALNPLWADNEHWAVIQRNAHSYTDFYLLTSVDRKRNADGEIVRVVSNEAIFLDVFWRTLWISAVVTCACLILGYPVAFLLASLPARISNLLMLFVLLPFWTALLVRTTAWIVILQREGVLNSALLWLGVTSKPLELIFNRTGLLIAMTHVLLPYMVLPIYSVMKSIDRQHMRAARSLGADGFTAFRRIYLPQTLPGVSAGCVIVYILALGYYVTPTLVGGAKDQLVSTFIANYTNVMLNWGQASALAVLLLVIVAALFLLYQRVVRFDSMKVG